MLRKLGMANTNKSYYQKYAKINKTVRSFTKVISICIRILETSSFTRDSTTLHVKLENVLDGK